VKPVTLKPAPVTLSDETVRLAVPVFLSVTTWLEDVPSATLPKVTLEGVTEMPACVPVPLSEIAVGEAARFVATEMLPDAAPVVVGENTALKVMVLLGATVCAVKPETLKPVPVALADETTRFAVPVFVSVTSWLEEVPSTTLPKLTLDGVTDNPGSEPAPVSAIVVGVADALVTTEMLPETAAVEVGANVALKVMVLPAARD